MSSFTSSLIVSPMPDGKRWVVRRAFSYDVGAEGSGTTVTVPAGFVTDFASVPRPIWWILPKWGRYGNAAVIHDYLYASKLYSRPTADAWFLEAMGVLGVRPLTRWVMYKAVRWFGWLRYRGGDGDYVEILDGQTIEIMKMEVDKF